MYQWSTDLKGNIFTVLVVGLMLFSLSANQSYAFFNCFCPETVYEGAMNPESLGRSRSPVPMGDFEKLLIPVKRANNLLVVEAEVDGVKGNFIVDLGAPYLVLNETYFRDYEMVEGLIAGTMTDVSTVVNRTRVDKLNIRELYFRDVQADVLDLSHIENKRDIKILGLLGLNLFLELEVQFNVREGQMTLYKLDDVGERYDQLPTDLKTDIFAPLKIRNNVILIDAEMGGKKVRFCFDTAAEINVLDQNLPGKVLDKVEINSQMKLGGAGSRQIDVFSGTMNDCNIEGVVLQPMRMILTDMDAMRRGFGLPIDGMLGYEFMAKGIISINFKKEELRFHEYGQ